jgi:ABC-type multidrug transport system ATPase subunit
VYEEITDGHDVLVVGNREVNGRAYCASFNFKGSDQQKKVGDLSGGERNRVHLAKLLRSAGNVLLLDEPTNDLDVDTLRALEEALLGFAGCVVVISHDRWFLDRIATHMLAFEGESHVEFFEGNYQEYEADLKRRKGVDADQFKRAAELGVTKINIDTDGRLVWTRVHREFFRDKPENFDLRPPGKVFMGEYAKFIAGKNEKLGSAGQLETVRKLVG